MLSDRPAQSEIEVFTVYTIPQDDGRVCVVAGAQTKDGRHPLYSSGVFDSLGKGIANLARQLAMKP